MRYILLAFFLTALIFPNDSWTYNPDKSCESSQVRIQSEDGSFYIGQTRDGIKHGRGRYVSADGSEYTGEYRDGQPDGTGTYYYPDGRSKRVRYQSGRLVESWLLSHEPNEQGCVFGEFVFLGRYYGWYRGDRVKGYIPHGRGIMRYSNGSIFSGQWENGKMHGNGSVKWEDGSAYSGQWENGKRTGYGTYTWPNGNTYVGEWKENQMCGKGVYYRDGDVIKGVGRKKGHGR